MRFRPAAALFLLLFAASRLFTLLATKLTFCAQCAIFCEGENAAAVKYTEPHKRGICGAAQLSSAMSIDMAPGAQLSRGCVIIALFNAGAVLRRPFHLTPPASIGLGGKEILLPGGDSFKCYR